MPHAQPVAVSGGRGHWSGRFAGGRLLDGWTVRPLGRQAADQRTAGLSGRRTAGPAAVGVGRRTVDGQMTGTGCRTLGRRGSGPEAWSAGRVGRLG